MLREAINIRDPNTEIDEKEIDDDAHFTIYHPEVSTDNRAYLVTSVAFNVPYDKAEA